MPVELLRTRDAQWRLATCCTTTEAAAALLRYLIVERGIAARFLVLQVKLVGGERSTAMQLEKERIARSTPKQNLSVPSTSPAFATVG